MRYDAAFAFAMSWCADKGIPHSEFMEWDQDDRDKVIAAQMEKNRRCSSCGTAGWEWEEDRFAYHAESYRCMGCMHLDSLNESSEDLPGLKSVLVPRE